MPIMTKVFYIRGNIKMDAHVLLINMPWMQVSVQGQYSRRAYEDKAIETSVFKGPTRIS